MNKRKSVSEYVAEAGGEIRIHGFNELRNFLKKNDSSTNEQCENLINFINDSPSMVIAWDGKIPVVYYKSNETKDIE